MCRDISELKAIEAKLAKETVRAQEVVPAEYVSDPVLANRWCKMHPHQLFPQYPLSVYLDSNIRIVSDLTALTSAMTGFPVCMFRHKQRDCVYEEIHACLLKKKPDISAAPGRSPAQSRRPGTLRTAGSAGPGPPSRGSRLP